MLQNAKNAHFMRNIVYYQWEKMLCMPMRQREWVRESESGAKKTKSHQVKGRREKEMNLSKGWMKTVQHFHFVVRFADFFSLVA